jgi:hypothetical protein
MESKGGRLPWPSLVRVFGRHFPNFYAPAPTPALAVSVGELQPKIGSPPRACAAQLAQR